MDDYAIVRRYHVTVDGKRTTVSLPILLADLLAIKLAGKLSLESVREITLWLQQCVLKKDPQYLKWRRSQQLNELVLRAVVDQELLKQCDKIAVDKMLSEVK